MDLVLDLSNFDSPEADGSRYVLTSPRSLEACARMKIRPIQLLPKPIDDFIEENPGKPLTLLQVFRDNHEEKRVELVQKCKEMRQTIIMENKIEKNGKSSPKKKINSVSIETQSVFSPRNVESTTRKKPQAGKEDENNNPASDKPSSEGKSRFEKDGSKKICKPSDSRRKYGLHSNPGKGAFVKSRSRPMSNSTADDDDEPYMISTSPMPSQSGALRAKYHDTRGRMPLNGDSTPTYKTSTYQDRRRSRSLEVRRRKHTNTDLELASSLKFADSKFMSGQSTPRQQRDDKMVELMKEKRRTKENEALRAIEKRKEWEEKKKREESKKHEEYLAKLRSLRQSHLEWEKKIRGNEERRVREEKRNEIARLSSIEESQKQIERTKKEQALKQQMMMEEKRKADAQKKKLQEMTKESVEKERQAFLEATGRELDMKMEKAQRVKLEKEMELLNKLKFMNKTQREKFRQIENELERRKIAEEEKKRRLINEKLEKAEILRAKKLSERDEALRLQAQKEEIMVFKTKIKQAEITKETDDRLHSLAESKKEALRRANADQTQIVQEKARKAQIRRETQQEEQRRRLKEIEREEEKTLEEAKELLASKDFRAKTHQQLKEAAIQMSRNNARAAEAARQEVKQKDDTFLEGAKHVSLMMSIGRGPRTAQLNNSNVKFG